MYHSPVVNVLNVVFMWSWETLSVAVCLEEASGREENLTMVNLLVDFGHQSKHIWWTGAVLAKARKQEKPWQ